jgi:hypothetical protein
MVGRSSCGWSSTSATCQRTSSNRRGTRLAAGYVVELRLDCIHVRVTRLTLIAQRIIFGLRVVDSAAVPGGDMSCSDTIASLIGQAEFGSTYTFGLTRHFQYPPGPVYAATDQTHGWMQLNSVPNNGAYPVLVAAHWTPLANYLNAFSNLTVSEYGVYFSYAPAEEATPAASAATAASAAKAVRHRRINSPLPCLPALNRPFAAPC